ncbi:MAG: VTT domain-containing protein [Hyphomicrobium sp.]|nr:VTT domain-containing protein [Hyphomicrobium sp.]
MTVQRVLPIAVLAALVGVAYWLRVDQYLTLDTLRDNRAALLAFVEENKLVAALGFVSAYAAAVAVSLPGAVILTLAGGFLFGVVGGAALTVIGATIGAAALFLIARSAFGDVLRAKAGPFVARMADGFQENAFSYLLFLRLVPAFPFWAVNLAPALLGMRFVPFVTATAIGIIPGTTVYSAFGAGLGQVFDAGGEVNLADIFSPPLVAGLIGLGVLSLLPILLKRWKAGRPTVHTSDS